MESKKRRERERERERERVSSCNIKRLAIRIRSATNERTTRRLCAETCQESSTLFAENGRTCSHGIRTAVTVTLPARALAEGRNATRYRKPRGRQ
jgi:hypothetical protein